LSEVLDEVVSVNGHELWLVSRLKYVFFPENIIIVLFETHRSWLPFVCRGIGVDIAVIFAGEEKVSASIMINPSQEVAREASLPALHRIYDGSFSFGALVLKV
jgi:hypothetical protein